MSTNHVHRQPLTAKLPGPGFSPLPCMWTKETPKTFDVPCASACWALIVISTPWLHFMRCSELALRWRGYASTASWRHGNMANRWAFEWLPFYVYWESQLFDKRNKRNNSFCIRVGASLWILCVPPWPTYCRAFFGGYYFIRCRVEFVIPCLLLSGSNGPVLLLVLEFV